MLWGWPPLPCVPQVAWTAAVFGIQHIGWGVRSAKGENDRLGRERCLEWQQGRESLLDRNMCFASAFILLSENLILLICIRLGVCPWLQKAQEWIMSHVPHQYCYVVLPECLLFSKILVVVLALKLLRLNSLISHDTLGSPLGTFVLWWNITGKKVMLTIPVLFLFYLYT